MKLKPMNIINQTTLALRGIDFDCVRQTSTIKPFEHEHTKAMADGIAWNTDD